MNVGIPQWSGELETQRFCVHDMFSLSLPLSASLALLTFHSSIHAAVLRAVDGVSGVIAFRHV